MQQPQPLNYGKFYHIYNKGVNSCDLFYESTNYEHFLKLYDTYISPVADTYAWVLMKNHFHLLIRIKEEAEIGFLSPPPSVVQNPDGGGDKNQDYLHPETLSGSETTERVKNNHPAAPSTIISAKFSCVTCDSMIRSFVASQIANS